ncbi:hypothetical protein LCGC14_1361480 [marine sediment metagenome]|uniref:N4-gp56 family major capsid protein n=1 Tax=marine sediment metagenome TaxID=412755 RepID=A0A0F9K834_9ZZZZ
MATKTDDLQDTIPTVLEEAQFTQEFTAVMRPLVWEIPKKKGSTVNVPYFGTVVSRQLSEGVDLTNDDKMEDTNVQITPFEAGLKIVLTDVVIEDDNEALIRAAGSLLGNAYERKRDVDLLETIDNASSSLAGSTNSLAMGHFAAARAILSANTATVGPAPMPYAAVIHPFQELDIVDIVIPLVPIAGSASAAGIWGGKAQDVLLNYSIGRLFGMPVIVDGNLSTAATAGTGKDTKGGVFAAGQNGGIIYVSAREPDVRPTRDESLRGVELVYVGRYGVGNYVNDWTVELWTNADTPA